MFTIDAEDNRFRQYRLLQSGQWRRLEGVWARSPDDRVYGDFSETVPHTTQESLVELDGVSFLANPDIIEFGREYAHIFVRAHRERKPRKFSVEELETLIREGDDSRLNVLTLSLDGRFALLDPAGIDWNRHPVAVRNEAWCEGNGYVGVEAAADPSHISETYLGMLQGWLEHLKSGRMDFFVDMPASMPEDALWAEVESLYH